MALPIRTETSPEMSRLNAEDSVVDQSHVEAMQTTWTLQITTPRITPFKEEDSLGDDDFIVPKDPLEQEWFKWMLLATARSLKKQKRKIKAEHDTLNDRWTKVLADEEGYDRKQPIKSYPKRRLLPQFDDEAIEPTRPTYTHAKQPDRPLEGGTEKLTRPSTPPPHLAVTAMIKCGPLTSTTSGMT